MTGEQMTVGQALGEEPTIGVPLDERTHYAHARYAASEHPGVIWYDPRDGHEKFAVEDVPADAEVDVGERHLTGLTLYPRFGRCQLADPDDNWVVEQHIKTRRVRERADETTYEVVLSVMATDVYENVHAAREAAGELSEAYADAEHRDAVAFRTEGESA